MRKSAKALESTYLVSFILRFSAILLLGFILFGTIVIVFLNKRIGPTYAEGIYTLNRIQAYLPTIIFTTAFAQALVLCLMATLLALFWSQRVAGPLLRFRRSLRNIYQGNFLQKPILFRDKDQLHLLAQSFSKMALAHRDRSAKALTLLVEAQRIIDESKNLDDKGTDERLLNLKLQTLKKIYLSIKDVYAVQKSANE